MAFLLAAAFAALYVLTRSPHFSYDGLCYALDVDYGPTTNLFHANHLLYGFLMRALWHGAQHCGYSGRAIVLMRAANLLAAASAVGVLFRAVCRRLDRAPALLAATGLGFSHALWLNAADPGCYGVVTLAATALLALFLNAERLPSAFVGVLHGALILIHQLLVLPIVAFLPRVKRPGLYALSVLLSAGVVYAGLGWHFHGPGVGPVAYWLTHPADAIWSPPGTHFWTFQLGDQWHASLLSLTQSILALPASALDMTVLWALLLVGLAASWMAARIPRAAWWWLLAFWLFQWVYFPGALTYRLFSLPLLWALVFSWGLWRHRAFAWVGAFGILILALHNGHAARHRLRKPDVEGVRVAWLRQLVGPHDFLLFAGRGDDSVENVYMAYFGHDIPARSLYGYRFSHPDGDLKPLEMQLRDVQARGGRVFIESGLTGIAPLVAQSKVRTHVAGPDGYAVDQRAFDFHAK